MTITRQDIKILKSDNVSDFDDGGGRVTNREVVDGESNDLFSDIPDTSRAYGDVDMVKIYPAVTTDDNDALLGSIFSLGRLPEDDSVNITLFSTKDWFDTRKQAIKSLESYLAPSIKLEGELLETQLKGQQVIQVILPLDGTVPTVGKSYYLVQHEEQPNFFEQYVFVTSVSVQEKAYRGGTLTGTYKVATLELSTKLDYSFKGVTPTQFGSTEVGIAIIRETRVADTSNYYTTKPLVEDVLRESASIKVDDIFTQLVPSARQDKPLSGLNPAGVSQALVPVGIETTIELPSFTVSSLYTYNIGVPITPNTLNLTLGTTVIEESSGVLSVGGVTVGFVDYQTGMLSWLENYQPSTDTLVVKFLPASIVPTINDSLAIEITEGNRGLSMAWTLDTPPLAGSLIVTYIVLGDIYTLRDQGGGILKGANDSFGVGRITYENGDVLLTFGSEPDVGSHVLFTWANNKGVSKLAATSLTKLGFKHTLPVAVSGRSINVSSIVITWGDKTATVKGRSITGDATGSYNPNTRVLHILPNVLPPVGVAYSVTYNQLPLYDIGLSTEVKVPMYKEPSTYHEDEALVLRFPINVSHPNLRKGSFVFSFRAKMMQNIPFKAQMGSRVLEVYEGSGSNVGSLYFNGGVTSYDQYDIPNDPTIIKVGTIDYTAGIVSITVSAIRYTWWEQTYEYATMAFGSARYSSK